MKLQNSKRQQGNTLMVVLFFCLAIGMVLAGILTLISARYANTVRSNDWNTCIPVLEAGVEEAMTHLHDDTSPGANSWTSTSIAGSQVYTKQHTFSDGSFYSVTIYNASATNPVIYSQGYVPSPLSGSQYISRLVRVGTANSPTVFTKAIATTGAISMSGGGFVDGFDSRVGVYDTGTNRNATGNVASDSTAKPAISVGTGKVYGTAVTGPGGTVSVAGGAVGDVTWDTSNTGIQPGATNNNMNVAFPTNAPPTGTPTTWPSTITAGGSNVTLLAGSLGTTPTYYSTSSFTSSDSSKPLFITGNVILYVSGTFTVSGSGYVEIMPGASLTLIVGGKTTISGGGVVNQTGLASDFSFVGTSSCTSITYSGSAAFIGTVNAPQAALTISGSAGAYGAVIANSASLSGGASFHYDDALGASGGLIATSWTEL